MKKLLLGGLLFSAPLYIYDVYAGDLQLDDLTQQDVDNISKEFSGNFVHTTVSGAKPLGSVFGFEVGVIGKISDSPKLGELVKEQSSSADVSSLYDAGLLAQVSVPFGITGELVYLPEMDLADIKATRTSLGVKWTLSDSILPIPFMNLAVRAHYSMAELKYSDVINNASTLNTDVNSEIAVESSSYGANVIVSFDLLAVEPYAGVGYVSSDTDINVSATGGTNIFSFTDAQSASSSSSGLHYFVGAQANLLFFKLGAEYSNVYGVDRVAGKISFGF